MMNMNILSVVTPPYIYHGWSPWKTFREENFTGEENFTLGEFSVVNMKICCRRNVRKHRDIKGSDKYVTLDISLNFDSLEKMRITSSESKVRLKRSGKGLITYLGLNVKVRPHEYKKARYAIVNVSKKYPSKIIREFEKLERLPYEKKSRKHEPTDSYFYLAMQPANFMTRAHAFNWHS